MPASLKKKTISRKSAPLEFPYSYSLAGNTNEGSITVPLTSHLTGLESAV